jgi:hypothetical protein
MPSNVAAPPIDCTGGVEFAHASEIEKVITDQCADCARDVGELRSLQHSPPTLRAQRRTAG